MFAVESPFAIYTDTHSGLPLQGGNLYFGVANQNPETNPVTVYWDQAATQPAAQPIRTLNGLIARNGTPATLYVVGDYSLTVRSKDGRFLYTVRTSASWSLASFIANLSAAAGAGNIGFDATLNYVSGTIGQDLADRSINPRDFPWLAKFDGVNDDAESINAALEWLGSVGGGTLELPRGTANCSASLNLPKNVIIVGKGKLSSVLKFTGAGDGIKSTWPINSSTAVRSAVNDLAIVCTNGASTGGGFVDVGGTFIDLSNVFFQGWKYGAILDQTEVATIDRCEFLQGTGQVGIWLVNGADHTAGANAGYTNRIAITRNQFNGGTGSGENVIDDGGSNHALVDNNFNAGAQAIRAAGVAGLRIQGNESEGHSGSPFQFTNTTKAGAYVGPCNGGSFDGGNTVSDITTYHLLVDDLVNFEITGNSTGQALSAFVGFSAGSPAVDVLVDRNSKLVTGNFRTASNFISVPTTQIARNNKLTQVASTFVAGSISAGSQAVTPATMEAIRIGTRLVVLDADGSASESVQVTNVTATTFTAPFANAHAANFLVRGVTTSDEEEGTWTPAVVGSTTAGASAYTLQAGTWVRRGNFVHAKFSVTVSVKDASMAGAIQITGLPFTAENIANQVGTCMISGFTGLTFPGGFTQLGGTVAPNTAVISLLRSGSGSSFAPPQASEAASAFALVGEVILYTSGL